MANAAPNGPGLPATPAPQSGRARTLALAAWVSLGVGLGLFGVKMAAYVATGSALVLSDALEGLANIAAALFALYSVRLAHKPADADHPYGHGKIEHFAAGFEGGLIWLAGGAIVLEAARRLGAPPTLGALDTGAALVTFAAVANGVTGAWLVRVGRAHHSPALTADGRHLLTDVVTSVAVLAGLLAVWLTGLAWLDPVFALGAAAWIMWTGFGLVRDAVGGLMDQAPALETPALARALDALDDPLVCATRGLRVRDMGARLQADVVVYVPDRCPVLDAHAAATRVEHALAAACERPLDVVTHIEPASLRTSGPPRTRSERVKGAPEKDAQDVHDVSP